MGRALVRDPKLFLFDEPLSNLDAKLRVEMRTEIKKLHQRIGTTIVYVTHDQIEAMTLATPHRRDAPGRDPAIRRAGAVYDRPANMFVARFMGSPPMNTLPARLEASDAGPVAVVGHSEDAIRLPAPFAVGREWLGKAVVLGIRPECIAEPTRAFGEDPTATMTISAPVEMTEPTGAETIVVMRLGGEKVLGRIAPDIRLPSGAVASFAVDTRKICLFDPSTERLIG